MIVAVSTVRVVEVSRDYVIHVFAMRRGFMAATWTVRMFARVSVASVIWRAVIWVSVTNGNGVLIDVIRMHMMQMTIMKIIGMPVVVYRHVPTIGIVQMSVFGMHGAITRFHSAPFESAKY
jgi:hypothetical protein